MFIYHLKLQTKKLPLKYEPYFSSLIISANSEEEARNMANEKTSFQGCENRFNLELVKAKYIEIEDLTVPGAMEEYNELCKIDWYSDGDNEIWKNAEFTEIEKIGTSDLTEPKIHCYSFKSG